MEQIFIVNEEQRAILETVERFVEEEVRPRAAERVATLEFSSIAGFY